MTDTRAPHQPPPGTAGDRYPEAAGPGTERDDGSVAYGGTSVPDVVIFGARDPADRDRDRALFRDGCARCQEVPAALMQELVRSLREAKAGAR